MAFRGMAVCNRDTAGGLIRELQTWVRCVESDDFDFIDEASFSFIDGQAFSFLEQNNPVAIVGCPVDPHAPCPVVPIHCKAVMAEGASWITIDGVPVCFMDHRASCGHPATGRDWIGMVEGGPYFAFLDGETFEFIDGTSFSFLE